MLIGNCQKCGFNGPIGIIRRVDYEYEVVNRNLQIFIVNWLIPQISSILELMF